MAETTQVAVTRTWSKIADGDCTVQSVSNSDFYEIAVSEASPTNGASIVLKIIEPTTFAYKTAVWCRIHTVGKDSAILNVIK